jgi:hypothetical protein
LAPDSKVCGILSLALEIGETLKRSQHRQNAWHSFLFMQQQKGKFKEDLITVCH